MILSQMTEGAAAAPMLMGITLVGCTFGLLAIILFTFSQRFTFAKRCADAAMIEGVVLTNICLFVVNYHLVAIAYAILIAPALLGVIALLVGRKRKAIVIK